MSKDAILIYKPLDIEIGLRRSKRAKRISMRFTAPDKISISYPIGIPRRLVEDFISRNQNWLLDKKKCIGSNINVGIGVKIPFKGRLLLISQGKDLLSSCKTDRDKILVNSHGKNVGSQVRDFLIGEIRDTAIPFAIRFSRTLGENYKNIKFKDTKSRWGSCTSDKSLMLSWRLIMAPEEVLEYVIAHEVAHLRHMNHGIKFWETVKILCHDYKPLREWIRSNGTTLFKYNFNEA